MGYEGKLQIEDALRPGTSYSDFRRMLDKYSKAEAVMVVGHNPNLSEFLGRIVSDGACEAAVDLKKGAAARIELNRSSGVLQWCLTPKVLRTLHAAAADSVRAKSSRK